MSARFSRIGAMALLAMAHHSPQLVIVSDDANPRPAPAPKPTAPSPPRMHSSHDENAIAAAALRRARKAGKRLYAHTFDIKVVPDAEPNADGEWIHARLTEKEITEMRSDRSWITTQRVLQPHAPAGHHIVAISRGGSKG